MPAHPSGTDEFLAETSLDPADWAAFRASAHRALDDAIDFLRGARERPVCRPVSEDVRAALATPLLQPGQSPDQVFREFTRLILP